MRPRLHLATTVPQSLDSLLVGQPAYLSRQFDVTVISSPGDRLDAVADREGVAAFGVEMKRAVTPLADVAALWQLCRWFRRTRPQLVQSYTPKAGLLVMAAAALARVPVRVHGIVGMPLMEASGLRRQLLLAAERATYALSTRLTCNSTGLRSWVLDHVSSARRIDVIGEGSINGVDPARYRPADANARASARRLFGIDEDATVILYAGRLVGDKGIGELLLAFEQLRSEHDDVVLLLVGSAEPERDPLSEQAAQLLRSSDGIVNVGWCDDVRPYYSAADIFALPSYREGLPNALLEASACGLACVATDINGCNEVVADAETGLLIPVRDSAALASALERLLDVDLRARLGCAARRRVRERYDQRLFWESLLDFYRSVVRPAADQRASDRGSFVDGSGAA
ncbi:glycosyltransferase family 4 protein [Microlunatus ginsengisoli]|uniref:Glycosyltransferase family 4 protein n=1 Tax=Microlunatus ginsengisoli TaxID=363863 RepID=A0ABP6ZFV7_9ACTN